MSQELALSIASEADLPALAALRWRLKAGDDALPHGDAFVRFADAFIRSESLARAREDVVNWIANIDGAPAAAMSLVVVRKVTSPGAAERRWGYLTNCYVVAGHRNAGVGSRVLEAIQSWAKDEAFEFVIVWPSDRAFPSTSGRGFSARRMCWSGRRHRWIDAAAMKCIRPHDPRWKDAFVAEVRVLEAALGAAALAFHHVGSTAVAGVWAKPIIDIAVAACALEDVDARTAEMHAIGYEARGEYGINGRRYFRKATAPGEGFHVHVFALGSDQITRHLQFRDFLLLRPDVARAYSALKQSLAGPDGVLVDGYAARKAAFVRNVQTLAQQYFTEQR